MLSWSSEPPAETDVETVDAPKQGAAIPGDRVVDLEDDVGSGKVRAPKHPGGPIELLQREHAFRHFEFCVEVLVAHEPCNVVPDPRQRPNPGLDVKPTHLPLAVRPHAR